MISRWKDFPPIPTISSDWPSAAIALAKWLRSFRDFMTAQNRCRITAIDFLAPATPSALVDVGTRPIGCELLALWSVDANDGLATKAPNAPLSWSFANGTISLPSLAGLTPSGKYRAVVRITEGVG